MRRVTYLKLSARDSQRFRIPLIPVILGCLNLYLPAMKCHYCGRPAGLIRLRCPACKTRLIQWYLVTAVLLIAACYVGFLLPDSETWSRLETFTAHSTVRMFIDLFV